MNSVLIFAACAASALASTSPRAGGKLAMILAVSKSAPPMLGRAFFNGLPIVISSAKLFPKILAVLMLSTWAVAGAVIVSSVEGAALGDFLELAALSGSAECCRLSCRE